jgi:signal transduction histidine kinase
MAQLYRTTTFRLTLAYLVVFCAFAALLLGYFALNTRRILTDQIVETISFELHDLADQYRQGGIVRLATVIESRSRRPGSNLYLLTDSRGIVLAGNVMSVPAGLLDKAGWTEMPYDRIEDADTKQKEVDRSSRPEHGRLLALTRVLVLPGGFRLLVGRDLEDRERLYAIISSAGPLSAGAVILLGLAGGLFASRRVLRRIDAMTETSGTIMRGNLDRRLPVSGTGDELDRLATNLNDMLDRIGLLMNGIKEVSDNIAHDLKTPLTRVRNRAEQVLRAGRSNDDYREALEGIIDEADGLIRLFNALLMIARAEAGHFRDAMVEFDAAALVTELAELYEPVAEESGIELRVEPSSPAFLKGSRELVTQAMANLLDNAIKYSAPSSGKGEVVLRVERDEGHVTLTVADRGPGIPNAERSHVLMRFVRLESSRSLPGSGLGLSLVSAVARLHGGEFKLADNAPGLRSVITLPLTGGNGVDGSQRNILELSADASSN